MPLSDDIKEKAEYTKEITRAMEEIGMTKHMWLKYFGKDSEPQVDLIIKEATDKAEEIVAMDDHEFLQFMKDRAIDLMKDMISHADGIGVIDDEEDEKEFKNERSENGDFKDRVS